MRVSWTLFLLLGREAIDFEQNSYSVSGNLWKLVQPPRPLKQIVVSQYVAIEWKLVGEHMFHSQIQSVTMYYTRS